MTNAELISGFAGPLFVAVAAAFMTVWPKRPSIFHSIDRGVSTTNAWALASLPRDACLTAKGYALF